jgi:DNA anti-recombination protein RmuC
MAEFEFAGTTFRGGKMFMVLTALSTLGGAAWGGFEIYKDYMDMKEIIQNIDTTEIENRNKQIEIKLDEAIEYTRDIKTGLRDDILGIEKQVDRMEDKVRETEQTVRDQIAVAEERFENKRDALQNDYDEKANRLAERNDSMRTDLEDKVDREIKDLEDRLGKKLQRALDNPLAN